MAGYAARSALSEEIGFLRALQRAGDPFVGITSPAASRIIEGWRGTLTVLIQELEDLRRLDDDGLRARLNREIELNNAFLEIVNARRDHPDADSWRRFFEEENEIAQELISLI